MKMSRRILLPLAVVLVAGIGLGACGSDSKDSTKTGTDSSSTSSTSTAAADAVVKETDNATVGTILVTADGLTVYTLTKDGAAVDCTGGCLAAWPPVLLPAGTDTATGASDLGVVDAAGGKQVTSKGLPLYTFSGDSGAGDVNGDGLESFGGTWKVVTVGASGAADTGTSSTTSGSGYDY